MRRRLLGEDHHDTLTSANNLAVAWNSRGDAGRAAELLADTVARRRRILGDHHPDTLLAASNLAAIREQTLRRPEFARPVR